MTKAESRLRSDHRRAILKEYPNAIVVSQPASETTGPGRTDFYVVVFGRYVGLEIKTRTGRATLVQLERIARIRRAGGWAGVVRSPDESVALIEQALKESRVWNNLFDDEPDKDDPEHEEDVHEEIHAFTEPQVEAEVRKNGVQPAGDGVMQEPPADYPYAVIIQGLSTLDSKLSVVIDVLRQIAEATGITLEVGSVQAESAEVQEQPQARRSRNRSKKQ